jgi:hypothetical protein
METGSVKYQFSNAPLDTGVEWFARDCYVADTGPGHAFEDGKGIAVSSQITKSVVGPDVTTV